MARFFFASADRDNHDIWVFSDRANRDFSVSERPEWHALDSRTARKCAERVGLLYLDASVQANDLPRCTLQRIHWVYDGFADSYGNRFAHLAAW